MKNRFFARLIFWAVGAVVATTHVHAQTGGVCTYALSPTNRVHGYGATTGMVSVVTSSNICSWIVVNTNDWISITSATNGTGNGSVNYAVAANTSTSGRTGEIQIADQQFTLSQTGEPCTFSISPTNRVHGYGATTNTVTVTSSVSTCPWTVVNTNTWIAILSGANGTGSAVVTYAVAANSDQSDRSGTVLIAGQILTLTQSGVPCTYSISPTNRVHGYGATTNSISVTGSVSTCPWTVTNTNDWISILSGTNGAGNGTVTYAIAANSSSNNRSGTVLIADQTLTLTQLGVQCSFSISPTNRVHGYGATTNGVSVASSASSCPWSVVNTNTWITILSGATGTGSGIVTYAVAANTTSSERSGIVLIADQTLTLTQSGVPCTYSISPTNRVHGYGAASNSVSITTSATTCQWSVVNTNSWISILSSSSGTGSSSVSYVVAANTSPNDRSGTVLIADQPLTLTQLGIQCTPSISPTNRVHGYGAATNSVSVTIGDNCSWSVVNTNDWITITSPVDNVGNGTVNYSLTANLGLTNRTGVITIADAALTLTQRGAPPLYFQSITIPSGCVRLVTVGAPGGVWELQVSSDLSHWNQLTNLINDTDFIEYFDVVGTNSQQRFYRAMFLGP